MSESDLEKLVYEFSDKPWNWFYLSKNKNISLHFVEKHPYFPWFTIGLYLNPNMTQEWMDKHPEYHWRIAQLKDEDTFEDDFPPPPLENDEIFNLSKNSQMDYIENNKYINWSWTGISLNKNLTYSFIKRNINKPFEWLFLSMI
jgi:hypothetical protein